MERTDITQIKGISSVRRLPRLGKIRLGVKVKTERGTVYPKEVPYFVCDERVQAVYGEQPKALEIMFPTEDENICFPQALKWYGSTQGLKCKGDGTTALRRWEDCSDEQKASIDNNQNPNDLVEITCPCEKKGGDCLTSGNLMVLLPKVSLGGVYQIDTRSISNIISINSYIDYLRSITNGRIALIPLELSRIEREMTYIDKNGKPHKVKHYMLQLEIKITMDDIDRLRRDKITLLRTNYQIETPKEDGQDLPEVIVDEEKESIEAKQPTENPPQTPNKLSTEAEKVENTQPLPPDIRELANKKGIIDLATWVHKEMGALWELDNLTQAQTTIMKHKLGLLQDIAQDEEE